jgi:hypothetical protein
MYIKAMRISKSSLPASKDLYEFSGYNSSILLVLSSSFTNRLDLSTKTNFCTIDRQFWTNSKWVFFNKYLNKHEDNSSDMKAMIWIYGYFHSTNPRLSSFRYISAAVDESISEIFVFNSSEETVPSLAQTSICNWLTWTHLHMCSRPVLNIFKRRMPSFAALPELQGRIIRYVDWTNLYIQKYDHG